MLLQVTNFTCVCLFVLEEDFALFRLKTYEDLIISSLFLGRLLEYIQYYR